MENSGRGGTTRGVRELQERGLRERQALRLVGMSPSTMRYTRGDGNSKLRERLKEQ